MVSPAVTATVRAAARTDGATIVAFIRELADYERLLHEVKITQAAV